MRALLPDKGRIAERFEREGAWALALKKLDSQFLEPLFSDARLDTDAARLKSGGVLCDLCDLLAEAGLSPVSGSLRTICGEDAERWVVLGRVYDCYLAVLRDFDLTDPNEARFAEIANPSRALGVDRLVIACIPDLPLVAQRYAEALVCAARRSRGQQVRIVRIFNTYGPRMHPNDGRVVSNFIVQALKGQDISIYGDGQQTRSFCYVDDLIEGFVRMMDSNGEFIGPVNMGNPGEFTMLELAEHVIRLVGGRSKLAFHPLPTDDPRQRQPDITLAHSALGWQPKVALEDGLKETIAYFRKFFT
jgi:hypothetical protein